jgi:RsmE family RNA methyltransferase
VAHSYLVEALDDATVGGEVVLAGAEARHAVTVSRVRVGDALRVGNGRGLVVEGSVQEARADRVVMVAGSVVLHARPEVTIGLVQALAKGDRDELAVQAATELGVDEVVPWSASRSVSRWEGAKIDKGLTRWRAITREATKQAVRPWGPEVSGLATTKTIAARAAAERVLVLEHDRRSGAVRGRPDRRLLSARGRRARGRGVARRARDADGRGGDARAARRLRAPDVDCRTGRHRDPERTTRALVSGPTATVDTGGMSVAAGTMAAMSDQQNPAAEPSVFSRIVARQIPADIVFENDRIIAFRDIEPQAPVHLLVVPKTPYRDVAELAAGDPGLLAELVSTASTLAADPAVFRDAEGREHAAGSFRLIFNTGESAGQTVFHVHAHVLGGPLQEGTLAH